MEEDDGEGAVEEEHELPRELGRVAGDAGLAEDRPERGRGGDEAHASTSGSVVSARSTASFGYS